MENRDHFSFVKKICRKNTELHLYKEKVLRREMGLILEGTKVMARCLLPPFFEAPWSTIIRKLKEE
jgi:hypothetical protein